MVPAAKAPHVFAKTKIVPKWEYPKLTYSAKSFPEEMRINISDRFVLDNMMKIFKAIEVYNYTFEKRRMGMDYHGISILAPKDSQALIDEMRKNCKPHKERDKLIEFLLSAISEDMYVIHFGI